MMTFLAWDSRLIAVGQTGAVSFTLCRAEHKRPKGSPIFFGGSCWSPASKYFVGQDVMKNIQLKYIEVNLLRDEPL